MNICLYHGIDLDGFCSGAIYAKAMTEAKLEHRLIPANYGWDLPWDDFAGADVTMIDFSLKAGDMRRLAVVANTVIVIDHHKTAIEELEGFSDEPNVELVLDSSKAGCELAWEHFFPGIRMPLAVELLGRYDVWDHGDVRVLPFQYGCRLEDLRPGVGEQRWLWMEFLAPVDSVALIDDVIRDGSAILRYQKKEDEIASKGICFEVDWMGYKWIVANRSGRGSMFFEAARDPARHAGMASYVWNGEEYRVGLYSDGQVDCSAIAKSFGGGGHAGAAGFSCMTLPFGAFDGKKIFKGGN